MREIKFRAWRKSWAMMVLPQWIIKYLADQHGIYGIVFDNPCTDGHAERENWDDVGDLVFMQFTGLKDKSGRGIYEGDIVHEAGTTYNWEVPELPLLFHLMGESVFRPDHCEVIGNIYENPDLIK